MITGRSVATFVAFLLAAEFGLAQTPAAPPLAISGDNPFAIDPATNSGLSVFWLKNTSKKTVPLVLGVGQYTSDVTHQIIPGKGVVGAIDGLPAPFIYKAPSNLAPGAQVPVKITVTDFLSVGGATAVLTNQGAPIGTVRVIKDRFPFKVAPPGWKEGVPYPLRISADNAGRITLLNEEPVRYVVAWTFSAPGIDNDSDEITIPPNSGRTIVLHPKQNESLSGDTLGSLFRDRESDGWLTLSAIPAEKAQFLSWWPSRHLPIKLSRSWWSDVWRPWASNALIVILLLLGGICSLILTNWVPNRTLKLNLQRRLEEIAEQIRTISVACDSMLRVSIRVERLRIKDSLNSRKAFSADYPALAQACETDIARLERLVGVVQRIDAIYRSANSTLLGFAPSIMRNAIHSGLRAEMQVTAPKVTDGALDDATKTVTDAAAVLAGLQTPNDEFKKKVTARVEKIVSDPRFTTSKFLIYARGKIPNLDSCVNATNPHAENMTDDNVCAIDSAVTKYEILIDVADIIDNLGDQRSKWNDVIERLLKNLRADNMALLRRADIRALELREDVHPDDVITKLKDGRFSIVCDPSLPAAGDTARFRVVLFDRLISNSSARDEIMCQWDFGDGLQESGWQVGHYYR
ncbi:MAG TPA: hypothetical protein VNN25_15030, partial [Thermoanaerobaculia bacterium]|nr:hypothetical protein [Thermoanaerobaculia bacterium]